jgi:hypothetical protein
MVKANKYHKFAFKYLLKSGPTDSAYQIAKADNNINNDSLYSQALEDMEREEIVLRNEKGKWEINEKEYSFIKEPQWRDVFSLNEELLDKVFNNKKMTFVQWFNEEKKLGEIMIKTTLKDMTQNNKLPKQLSNAIKRILV